MENGYDNSNLENMRKENINRRKLMVEIFLSTKPQENKVIIEGTDVTNRLYSVKVENIAAKAPTVELKFLPDKIKITGDAAIIRDKDIEDFTNDELQNEVLKRRKVIVNNNITVSFSSNMDEIANKVYRRIRALLKRD
jgi:hypothetical protein